MPSHGLSGLRMHAGWILCETAYEAEVVRRYGLWLPCDCGVSRWGYFHWVRSDGPAVGLWVMELSRGSLWGATFLRNTDWCVLTGYAHALSPSLAIGDVLMATAVFRPSVTGGVETLWPDPVPGMEAIADIAAAPCWVASPVPATPRRRQALYRSTGAWAVRPEGKHWLEVIQRYSPVGVLLWIMDTVQERTSPDDTAWRLQRHRAVLERHGNRIEQVVRRLCHLFGSSGIRQFGNSAVRQFGNSEIRPPGSGESYRNKGQSRVLDRMSHP